MIWWNPPLQGHNLGALHLDYFDLLASLALTVICRSLYNARLRWLPVFVWLVGQDSSSFFDLLFLDKSSLALLFLTDRLVGTSVCFCMIAILWRRLCFLAAGGGEELLFRVVVKRVLMMLWLYVVVVFAASSSLASTHHSHLFLDTSCTDDGFYSRNRSATVLLKYWNHTL